MIRVRSLSAVSSLSVMILVVGCSPAPMSAPSAAPALNASAAIPAAPTPQMIAEGQQIYRTTGMCAPCHGPAGLGTSLAPNLADDDWIWVRANDPLHPQLVSIIRNGIPEPRQFGTPMPPMGGARLSQQQVEAVAAYVGSL